MFKKFIKKSIFYVLLSCVSASAFLLISCVRQSESYAITADSSYVQMSQNETKTLQISYNFEDLGYSLSNETLVTVSIDESNLTISSSSLTGISTLKLYKESDSSIYQDILIVVGDQIGQSSYHIGIQEGYRTTYYYNEVPSFSDLSVYVYRDNSSSRIVLSSSEYFLSISKSEPLKELGSRTIYVSAPEYTTETYSFKIEVVYDEYYAIYYALENINTNNDYTMSFETSYGPLLELRGIIYKNDRYFINTYQDNFIVLDQDKLFVASYDYDEDGYYSSISASNGYISSLVGGLTIDNAISKIYGSSTLKDFNASYVSNTLNEGRYSVTNSTALSIFWNSVLGFNGSASELLLSYNYKEDSILYTIEGTLTSGIPLTFNGSIYNVGATIEDRVEEYLNNNYSITSVADEGMTSIYNSLNSYNYTVDLDTSVYLFNPRYVLITSGTSRSGYIETNNEVYRFTISNNSVNLGTKVEGINEVEELDLNIVNTSLLSSNLGSFVYSSYYDSYMSFDPSLNEEILDLYFSSYPYDFYGLGFTYSDDDTISLYAFYMTSSGIGGYYLDFTNIGNSSNEIIENYLDQ